MGEGIAWKEAAIALIKSVLAQTEMQEEIKWGIPVYTCNGKNVVGVAVFKSYVGVWFYNGVFLKDSHKLLSNAQESKTKALRQLRYTSLDEIDTALLLEYCNEALENEKMGIRYTPETKKTEIPAFLQDVFSQDKTLKEAFEVLTPGRQREYCEYIDSAKQLRTKQTRLEKIVPMIVEGKGLNDRYKNQK